MLGIVLILIAVLAAVGFAFPHEDAAGQRHALRMTSAQQPHKPLARIRDLISPDENH
jgi:hypothetical protein